MEILNNYKKYKNNTFREVDVKDALVKQSIEFTNYVYDNYVKYGDYFHLKGEVYWNTTRKDLEELLEEFENEK